ncbi:MAG TPA: sigma-70 family RNA polymerase sigma factor [Candidatus Kapabacteria bacterium]|nr:sigma-70 family RNA polymerase sigma factor [Candidatus Kapabacteria bacterium]
MTQLSDEELIRATLAGDQAAFAELVRRYQRRVTVTIRSVIGDLSQDDLADIAQDVFLLAYRSLGSFRGDSQFGTYLTRIALRHCYRESKRRKRRGSIFYSFDKGSADDRPAEERFDSGLRTDRDVIADERKGDVARALARLPEEFRTVLVLRIVEELSVEEVAEALGISTGTVKSRLYRAKERMRELLVGCDVEFQLDGAL